MFVLRRLTHYTPSYVRSDFPFHFDIHHSLMNQARQAVPKSRRNSSMLPGLRERFTGIPPSSFALLVFPCVTFYLGIWQLRRRKWKLELIETMKRKTSLLARQIPADLNQLSAADDYEKFELRGRFDYSRETFIGPRSLIGDNSGGLISSSSNIGYHVVTPFKLSDQKAEVLVNRGWIPTRMRHAQAQQQTGKVEGELVLGAVYRSTERGSQFAPKEALDMRSQTWLRRDVQAIAHHLGTAPLFFDADEKSSVPGGPIGGQTVVQLRNEHFSYIVTWFSLTALMLIIWSNRYLRRRGGAIHKFMKKDSR